MKYAAFALAVLASPAFAGQFCELDGTEMFSCTFNGGKKAVEVCDAIWMDGDMATYGFFAPGKAPELELTNEMTGMLYQPWNGVGTPWASVSFYSPDWSYLYEVWYSGEDGGITVTKREDTVAELTCDPGSVVHDLDAFVERIEVTQISP